MGSKTSRRDFLLKVVGASATAMGLASVTGKGGGTMEAAVKRGYGISLAGWSLHRSIGKGGGKIPMLDMPKLARQEFGIGAIELVNGMLDSAETNYLDQLAKNAADNDVRLLLIMVDREGDIGAETREERKDAVGRHTKWIDAAAHLGCHSIRMNWRGAPNEVVRDSQALKAFIDRSAVAFRKLCDYGDKKDINVLIENHGGPSSYPEAVVQLMVAVDHDRFGTLPDFGNFPDDVDIYLATDLMMNFAKAVSAKCYDFDDTTGEETKLDYARLIEIVVDKHGYDGYIGIEYEGKRLSEFDGIKACKKLLEKLRT